MKNKTSIWALITLACAIAAALWFFQVNQEAHESVAAVPSADPAKTPRPHEKIDVPRQPSASHVVAQGSLAQQFYSSSDLKASLIDLKARADNGDAEAKFYVGQIYEECAVIAANASNYKAGHESAITEMADKLPRNFNRGLYEKALDRTLARCGGFNSGELHLADARSIYQEAAKDGEIKAVAHDLKWDVLTEKGKLSGTEIQQKLNSIFQSKDPTAISEIADLMGPAAENSEDIFGPSSGTKADAAAWNLVACDLGLPCGSGSAVLDGYCREMYFCGYANLEDVYRNVFFARDEFDAVARKRLEILAGLNGK